MIVKFILPVKKTLDELKQEKIKELDKNCTETILGYFKVVVNGVEYEFSNDMEAQSRFNGIASAFSLGMITEVGWTVRKDGERYRLILSKDQFISVAGAAFQHQNINIIKFNQLLIDVDNARIPEDVKAIVW